VALSESAVRFIAHLATLEITFGIGKRLAKLRQTHIRLRGNAKNEKSEIEDLEKRDKARKFFPTSDGNP
jgi:hypothetical protein